MNAREDIPSWREVCAIMIGPKPPLWGRFVRDDQDRSNVAIVVFDGFDSWFVDDGVRIEMSGPQGSVFVKAEQVEHIDGKPAHANGWLKSLIQPRRMSLESSTGEPVAIEEWVGRRCWMFDVDGLKSGASVTFRLWIDAGNGIVLRLQRLDDVAATAYAEAVRLGDRIRPWVGRPPASPLDSGTN